jgi:hypothetical protein
MHDGMPDDNIDDVSVADNTLVVSVKPADPPATSQTIGQSLS